MVIIKTHLKADMNYLSILQSLLFMDFGGTPYFDYTTQHCFAQNSMSLVRQCNRACNNIRPTDAEIIAIKKYFGSTHFTWVIDADEKETLALLEQHELHYKGFFPLMVSDLNTIEPHCYRENITIREIMPDEFDTWVSIFAPVYKVEAGELAKALRNFIARSPQGAIQMYIGLYESEPVGVSMLIYHGSFATLHMVGVLEAYRNKGIGFALSHKPLVDARATGCTRAYLMASAAGAPLYPKLGFTHERMLYIYGNY
jgi:GNAT superfamily N-acetyltransferase